MPLTGRCPHAGADCDGYRNACRRLRIAGRAVRRSGRGAHARCSAASPRPSRVGVRRCSSTRVRRCSRGVRCARRRPDPPRCARRRGVGVARLRDGAGASLRPRRLGMGRNPDTGLFVHAFRSGVGRVPAHVGQSRTTRYRPYISSRKRSAHAGRTRGSRTRIRSGHAPRARGARAFRAGSAAPAPAPDAGTHKCRRVSTFRGLRTDIEGDRGVRTLRQFRTRRRRAKPCRTCFLRR